MSRFRVLAALSAFSVVFPSIARAEETSASPLTLADAIDRALDRNPDLATAKADVEEARGALRQGRAPFSENPEVEVWQATRTEPDGTEATDRALGVSQEVEIAFQWHSRLASGRAGLARAEALLSLQRGIVVSEVRAAFLRALAAQEKARFADEVVALTERLAVAARRREELGSGTALETNLAAIEWGDARRARLAARRESIEARADLGRLAVLAPDQVSELRGELRTPRPRELTLADFRERVKAKSDVLKASHFAADAARADLTLARKEVIPNVTVSAGWEEEAEREEIVGIGLSVPIPLFVRNQAGMGAARAAVRRAEALQAATGSALEHDIVTAWARWEASREELAVFDDEILKQVEENLRLLQASLEAGKSNLLGVVIVQRRLVDTRREYLDALAASGAAEAELDRLLGEEGVAR